MSKSNQLRDPDTIVLSQLYPFTVARLFIPSHQGDGPITLTTLHNWRREGRFTATYRPRGDKKRAYFLKGADIMSLIGVVPTAKPQRQASARGSSVDRLRKGGFKRI